MRRSIRRITERNLGSGFKEGDNGDGEYFGRLLDPRGSDFEEERRMRTNCHHRRHQVEVMAGATHRRFPETVDVGCGEVFCAPGPTARIGITIFRMNTHTVGEAMIQ